MYSSIEFNVARNLEAITCEWKRVSSFQPEYLVEEYSCCYNQEVSSTILLEINGTFIRENQELGRN